MCGGKKDGYKRANVRENCLFAVRHRMSNIKKKILRLKDRSLSTQVNLDVAFWGDAFLYRHDSTTSLTRSARHRRRAVSRHCCCCWAHSMQGGNEPRKPTPWGGALWIFEFSAPFCLGETRHYFKQCDLFRSFHAIVEVQFGGLARLDQAVNNYKDKLNSLNHHVDLTVTLDKALRNVIVSAYAHYIDLRPLNGACVGHRAILMGSLLQFAMHYSRYQCRQCYIITQHQRKGIPPSTPMPAIDLAALLDNEEEYLKPEQMNVIHVSIMDALGDPATLCTPNLIVWSSTSMPC